MSKRISSAVATRKNFGWLCHVYRCNETCFFAKLDTARIKVLCIEQILKTFKSLTNLQAKDPREWPSVKLVNKERMKFVSEESRYQGVKLMLHNQITLENCKKDVLNDLQRLSVKLKERLEWSDTQLLRSFLVFNDTKNWIHRLGECNDDVSIGEIVNAVEYITGIFRSPLEAKGMCLSSI